MPQVSVIVPIYNQEKYLEQCMKSIRRQTLKDIEIICVDDGSTDRSLSMIRKMAAGDSRILILTEENAGAGVARNKGLAHAKGEYITFLDSDDIFEPDMLEKLYDKAEKENLDVVVSRADSFDDASGKVEGMPWSLHDEWLPDFQPFSALDVEKNFFEIFVWWPWDKLYKRSFIEKTGIRFQPLRTTNDLFFVCAAVLSASRISYIQDVLVHHRIGMETSLSVTREKSWDHFIQALNALKEFLLEKNLYHHFRQDFINYCLNFSMWHLETLHDFSYVHLYRSLKHRWFPAWEVTGHEPSYFYQLLNYEKLQFIMNEPDLQCLEFKAAFLEKALQEKERELSGCRENYETLLREKELELSGCREKYKALLREKEKLEETNRNLQSAQQALLHSVSFRTGRALTWAPRKIRDTLK